MEIKQPELEVICYLMSILYYFLHKNSHLLFLMYFGGDVTRGTGESAEWLILIPIRTDRVPKSGLKGGIL